MTAAAPTTKDYLVACNLAYCEGSLNEATSTTPSQAVLQADMAKAMATMDAQSWTVVSIQYTPKDGFYGVSFLNNSGSLIIAYEGTSPAASTYGLATLKADAEIQQHHTPTQLFNDVAQFALASESAAQTHAGFNGNAYVTGHSLGGIEAESAAIYLNSQSHNAQGVSFGGGVTFGATGIPGYVNNPATAPKLVNYVDYGDPVGNYASHMPAGTGNDYIAVPLITPPQDHVGTVAMVGDPGDWNVVSPTFLTFGYHMLDHYAEDMGVSIPTIAPISNIPLAQQFWDLLSASV
ncbi:MAG: hypothetical protein F8N37_05005 [Telmatospirillum sp.]|nr:hypothetical protein [Telmatospirillum sp.]